MPNDDKTKKDAAYYMKKYGNYIGAGRYTDKDLADKVLPDSDKPYKQIVMEAAKKQGISPELLFASANEEGVRQLVKGDEYSGDDKYPVDGYAHFGLDTFGDAYPNLVKKGYLPSDMQFSPVLGTNEKGTKVHTANFKNVDDAMSAKAAMMHDVADQVNDYAAKRGYNLSDQDKQFFMLAGYNGGVGNAQKMLDSYNDKGVLANESYLKQKPESYGGIYDNVQRRMVPASAWKDDGIFADPTVANNTPVAPAVANPPQQSAGEPYYQNGKIIAYKHPDGTIVAAN